MGETEVLVTQHLIQSNYDQKAAVDRIQEVWAPYNDQPGAEDFAFFFPVAMVGAKEYQIHHTV
jgi:hypothetical protein